MKNKFNTAKFSANQRVGNWQEEKKKQRLNALQVVEQSKDLEHLKFRPIKYLLK